MYVEGKEEVQPGEIYILAMLIIIQSISKQCMYPTLFCGYGGSG